jgi:hypothetical protein
MAQENITILRDAVRRYSVADNEVQELNRRLTELRSRRSTIKDVIVDLLQDPMFSTYEKLENSEDGSVIKIKRPGTHSSGWSLGKGMLQTKIHEYFRQTTEPNATDCFDFISRYVRQNSILDILDIDRQT